MLNCYVKFYADTRQGDKNKYFCFKIKSILELRYAIIRFYDKGFNIRSAWYYELNTETGEFVNDRIPQTTMNEIFEEWQTLLTKQNKHSC